MAGTGVGAIVDMGGSGVMARVRSIGPLNETLPVLDDSTLDTTSHAEYCLGDLVEHEGFSLEIRTDDVADLQAMGSAIAVTIHYPLATGQQTAANFQGNVEISQRATAGLTKDDLMSSSTTMKFIGDITFVAATFPP